MKIMHNIQPKFLKVFCAILLKKKKKTLGEILYTIYIDIF